MLGAIRDRYHPLCLPAGLLNTSICQAKLVLLEGETWGSKLDCEWERERKRESHISGSGGVNGGWDVAGRCCLFYLQLLWDFQLKTNTTDDSTTSLKHTPIKLLMTQSFDYAFSEKELSPPMFSSLFTAVFIIQNLLVQILHTSHHCPLSSKSSTPQSLNSLNTFSCIPGTHYFPFTSRRHKNVQRICRVLKEKFTQKRNILSLLLPADGALAKCSKDFSLRDWLHQMSGIEPLHFFKFFFYLLQLFRRVLQHCFAVKLQKCFVDNENGKWHCKIFVVCSKWV